MSLESTSPARIVSEICRTYVVVLQMKFLTVTLSLLETCTGYPLYAAVAHNTLCDDAALAFRWLATSQGIVVLFAMLMLTARAGLYEMKDEPDVNENKESTPLSPEVESPAKDMDNSEEPNDLGDDDVQNDGNNDELPPEMDESLDVQ